MENNVFIHRDLGGVIRDMLQYYPVVTLTGPRQSGKTTLCRELFPGLPYVNLENVDTLRRIQEDVTQFFASHLQGVIIDEAHHLPRLFSDIQVIVDEDRFRGNSERKFIVTGSSNFALLEKVTQSMAGRTSVLTLLPLSERELRHAGIEVETDRFILNGGYPAVWRSESIRKQLYGNYSTTYIERDVRNLINLKDLSAFQAFVRLCAGRIGTEFNASALSVAVGVSVNTIRHWLSVLAASYTVYLLAPYHANIGKRLTKTPKLYFYDTGLAAYYLGIESVEQLQSHPLRGALFENMVLNEIKKESLNRGDDETYYFYRDKTGREIDLIRMVGLEIEAYEIKASKSFSTDYYKHLKYLQELIGKPLRRSAVIYDGSEQQPYQMNGLYNFREFTLYPEAGTCR
ncbi:MAG: ATP-binding protein [Prevotellaceae bacterium]|jgi:predicted AAA+ superfamily ATPase|nr:ATP-binding protein [Prevotellaceae bacterium]